MNAKPNGPNAPDEDVHLHLIISHTNAMLFVTLILLPGGMFVSRYYKETWVYTISDRPIWLWVHIMYMVTAFFMTFYGIYVAIVYQRPARRDITRDEIVHRTLGWLTLFLVTVQIISGFCLPISRVKVKICHHLSRFLHWFIGGFTSFIFLMLAMLSGLLADAQYPYFSSVVIFVWMLFALTMHFVYAWFMHKSDKHVLSMKEDGFKNYYRLFLPLPVPILLENVSDQKFHAADFRLLLFLWFQFGGLAAFSIIFLANSAGYGEYHCKNWAILQFQCSKRVPHIRYWYTCLLNTSL